MFLLMTATKRHLRPFTEGPLSKSKAVQEVRPDELVDWPEERLGLNDPSARPFSHGPILLSDVIIEKSIQRRVGHFIWEEECGQSETNHEARNGGSKNAVP